MSNTKKLILIIVVVIIALAIVGLVIVNKVKNNQKVNPQYPISQSNNTNNEEESKENNMNTIFNSTTEQKDNPIATMEIEGYGTVKIELYPEIAPQSVANFISLAQNGFYDGLKFHRVVKGFMIQGGDPSGDGSGSPKLSDLGIKVSENQDREYCIKGEFYANGHNNTLKHEKGVISMARADYTSYSSSLKKQSYNSGGSQFFIMTKDNQSLDGLYAPFGKVISGLDVIEKIENVEVAIPDGGSEKSRPTTDVLITKVTVETFGENYGLPETLETWDFYQWVYEQYGIDYRK